MSEETKKHYPRDYSDEELGEKVDEYSDHPMSQDLISSAKFNKASLGLAELHRRAAKKFGVLSLVLGGLAIIIAAIAAGFAYQATQISDEWQEEQLQVLNRIKCLLDDDRRGRIPC